MLIGQLLFQEGINGESFGDFNSVVNMVYSIHDLKVDQSSFSSERTNSALLVTNINIPKRLVENALPTLQRCLTFLKHEYQESVRVSFQVIATYQLIHNTSGAIRQWTGSFMPGRNHPNALQDFRPFGDDFIDQVLPLCDTDLITARLKFWNVNTHWSFHKFTSIVINVQGAVDADSNVLKRRNLLRIRHRRGHRNHSTYYLP